MSYCSQKEKGVVRWSFFNKKEQTFIAQANQLPIDVNTSNEKYQTFHQSFEKVYSGLELISHDFVIDAPPEVPKGLKIPPEIYLLSGVWDDHGTIGNYDTGYGIVKRYSGEPLKIGDGYSINGTVVNEMRTECYVRLSLLWKWLGCEITITSSQSGQKLLVDSGTCPVHFHVSCNDDCPSGYIRCETSQYPGYCCIPCNEIKSNIVAATNAIRSLNHG
ncbi:hypothetical protein BZZ01_11295 [Nostocales cyanobacterium HT-58-2]|nr:hypothetical protein BZZ01_11295 [Nostocales cyanobacterium HT-58-2]